MKKEGIQTRKRKPKSTNSTPMQHHRITISPPQQQQALMGNQMTRGCKLKALALLNADL